MAGTILAGLIAGDGERAIANRKSPNLQFFICRSKPDAEISKVKGILQMPRKKNLLAMSVVAILYQILGEQSTK